MSTTATTEVVTENGMETKPEKPKPKNMPHNSAFKQQRLRAWQPILTTRVVVVTFSIIGPIFIGIGIAALVASEGVQEYSVRYDETCYSKLLDGQSDYGGSPTACTATIDVASKMTAPVYLYYELDNYYQNHRRYVKSRNDDQLRGESVSSSTADDCSPLVSKTDLSSGDRYYTYITTDVINPCGLIAISVFNDTITFCKDSAGTCTSTYSMTNTGTAWSSDLDWKFSTRSDHWVGKALDETGAQMWPNGVKDESFIVWMRTAALPKFRKLFRIVHEDIPAGTWSFKILNRYDVSRFSGKKSIVLSTTSWLGGKNLFLGVAYTTVGSIIVMLAVLFVIKDRLQPRKLGEVPPSQLREAH